MIIRYLRILTNEWMLIERQEVTSYCSRIDEIIDDEELAPGMEARA